jgi:hypothetical protein
MSWHSRVYALLAAVVCASPALAQRIQFSGADTKARLETATVQSRDALAPVEVRLTIPGIDIDRTEDGFDRVSVANMVPMDIAGKPELMTTGTLVSVPEGFEAVVEVVDQKSQKLDHVVVQPAQRRFRCGPSRSGFEFDTALYQSREAFPASLIETKEVGRLQGVRLVRVGINPFQVRLADKQLEVTTDLALRVSFKQVSRARGTELPKSLFEIVRNGTANGRYLRSAVRPAAAQEKMLVYVGDSLKNAIAPLVAWESAKGLSVDVYTLTQAGGTKEAVKKHIQNIYDTAAVKPSYLLFVGNKTTMPGYMESTASGSAATDYTYSLLTGADAVPDVLYGRIVADNEAEVTTQVNRYIGYEKTPVKGSWYPQGATISSNEGSNPSDKEYAQQTIDALKANTYQKVDLFNQGDKTATPANIDAAMSEGRTWLSYWGHGSGTSWGSTNGSFGNTQVAALKNADRLPVIIDVACQNGSWVNLAKPFGKAWVTQESNGRPAGAVAYYGGSVNISWHPPAVMAVGVAKYHFEKPVHSMGGSVLAGQLSLIEKMGTGSNVTDNLKWYNLFGDPSLLIRTDIPRAYDVKSQVRKTAAGLTIEVKAVDQSGQGVQNLTASIVGAAGQGLAVGATDATGTASLYIPGVVTLSPNTVLTMSGYNAESHQVVLQ